MQLSVHTYTHTQIESGKRFYCLGAIHNLYVTIFFVLVFVFLSLYPSFYLSILLSFSFHFCHSIHLLLISPFSAMQHYRWCQKKTPEVEIHTRNKYKAPIHVHNANCVAVARCFSPISKMNYIKLHYTCFQRLYNCFSSPIYTIYSE